MTRLRAMDLELRGKKVLVAGASRGIGAAIARALGAEGAAVALVARGKEALAANAREVEERGGKAFTIAAELDASRS